MALTARTAVGPVGAAGAASPATEVRTTLEPTALRRAAEALVARGPRATAAVLDAREAGLLGSRVADAVAAGRERLAGPSAIAELTRRAAGAAGATAAVWSASLPVADRRAARALVARVAIAAATVFGTGDAALVEDCRADAVTTRGERRADATAGADFALDAAGTTFAATAIAPAVLAVASGRATGAIVADGLVGAIAVDETREAVLTEVRVAKSIAAARERDTLRAARARLSRATPGRTLAAAPVGSAGLAVASGFATRAVVADGRILTAAVLSTRETTLVRAGLAAPVTAVDELDAGGGGAADEGAGTRRVALTRFADRGGADADPFHEIAGAGLRAVVVAIAGAWGRRLTRTALAERPRSTIARDGATGRFEVGIGAVDELVAVVVDTIAVFGFDGREGVLLNDALEAAADGFLAAPEVREERGALGVRLATDGGRGIDGVFWVRDVVRGLDVGARPRSRVWCGRDQIRPIRRHVAGVGSRDVAGRATGGVARRETLLRFVTGEGQRGDEEKSVLHQCSGRPD